MGKSFRLAFICTFFMGILVHLSVLTNFLWNHDALGCVETGNDVITSGRWALGFFSSFSWIYEMPIVIGLLTIFFVALSAGLIVEILRITHPLSIIIVSLLLVSFPAIACIFSYLFTADAYFISLFLTISGVYLAKQYRYGWIPAIVCIGTAVGIYQAFFSVAIGLFLMDCLTDLLDGAAVKSALQSGCKYILVLLASGVFYLCMLRLILTLRGLTLSSYAGMDQAATADLSVFLAGIPAAYKNFVLYFVRPGHVAFKISSIGQLLLIAEGCGCGFYLMARQRQWSRCILCISGAALIPLALNFVSIITPFSSVGERMRYAYVLLPVFSIKLIEMVAARLVFLQKRWWVMPLSIMVILGAILGWNQVCITNAAYLRVQLVNETSAALANRIIARVEVMDGYSTGMPFVFGGKLDYNAYGVQTPFTAINDLDGTNEPSFIYNYAFPRLVLNRVGVKVRAASSEEIEHIYQSGILETMGSYPSKDSIQIYDEIVVVKLSD